MMNNMCRVVSFFFCFGFVAHIMAQQTLPSIKAGSTKVDIRIGNDYFLKGQLILEPEKNPDILLIENKWPYASKKVTYITDIDSITVDVRPGHTYDFTVMLHSTIPCHIQLVTVPNPIFLNIQAVLLIAAGFVIVLSLLYWYRNRLNTLLLLRCGYIVTILFWVMSIVSGRLHGNYNNFKNVISELGAVGSKPELFTSSFLLLLTLAGILFSIGFYRVSKKLKQSEIPAVLSFAMPVTMLWAGIFPLGNEWHSATGPLPLLTIIGSLLMYLLWKKEPALSAVKNSSLISFFIMLLIFTRFIRPFGNEYEGLVQRFFYLGWSIWTIGVSFCLSKEGKKDDSEW